MAAYEGWALVEQMGFRKTVAKVREIEQFGTKMLQMDVPIFDNGAAAPSGFYTAGFAGGPSLYQVTPLEEAMAINMARKQADPRPVVPMSYRLGHDDADDADREEQDELEF